jgi:hypothetical protein
MACEPATPSPPSDLPLFRFGLRQLFGFVAAVSVVLAGMVIAGGVTSLVLLLATLVVAFHVAGTALGNAMRARSDMQPASRGMAPLAGSEAWGCPEMRPAVPDLACPRSAPPAQRPTPSLWHCHGGPSLCWLPRLVIGGVLLGALTGAVALPLTIGHRTSLAGMAVGTISLAVLAGWLVFVAASFYAIFRDGWREAVAEEKP